MQGRVYLSEGGHIVKIYRAASSGAGPASREAENLRRAGLGHWVLSTSACGGSEAIVMRRVAGRRIARDDLPRALPSLRQWLEHLRSLPARPTPPGHQEELLARFARFRRVLSGEALADLFAAAEILLSEAPPSLHFCHLDLWQDNILFDEGIQRATPIDWAKADWEDPLRDLALLKSGTLDLLGSKESLSATLFLLGSDCPALGRRLRAHVALACLHDLYWLTMNEPYQLAAERERKLRRTRYALAMLPY